jgi:trigger factor
MPQTWEEVEGANEGVIPGLGKAARWPQDRRQEGCSRSRSRLNSPPCRRWPARAPMYAVEIQEVRERVLPADRRRILQGASRSTTSTALQAQVRNNLKMAEGLPEPRRAAPPGDRRLAAKADFPVPDSLVDAETQGVLRQFIEENMRRGVPQEQFEKDKKELFDGATQGRRRPA